MKLTILPETNKYDKTRIAKAEAKRKRIKERNLKNYDAWRKGQKNEAA